MMADTINLDSLEGDFLVLHFGGKPGQINATTLGKSLLEFAAALKVINEDINPAASIEVFVTSDSEGSYRVKLHFVWEGTKTLWAHAEKSPIISATIAGVLTGLILNMAEPEHTITINGDVFIEMNRETSYVIPRKIQKNVDSVMKQPAVVDHIVKAFKVLDADENITDFGVGSDLYTGRQDIRIERKYFSQIAEKGDRVAIRPDGKRTRRYPGVNLVIQKSWFDSSPKKKWRFIWNGFSINATISDQRFFERLAQRDIYIAQGDALHATLVVTQVKNEITGAWENDSYKVTDVDLKLAYAARQDSFLGEFD